jgi:hypothetical protein
VQYFPVIEGGFDYDRAYKEMRDIILSSFAIPEEKLK